MISHTKKEAQEAPYKRPPSKLDKYIDLILKNVTNVDEFIYLQRNNDNDPYDLNVVNFIAIKDNQLQDYYTISKKGLCLYVKGKPIEFILLAYWLKERETYDQIKSLQFFKKFRKWKTLRKWKENVIRHKTNNIKRQLQEKLILLHPILGPCILEHRKYCFEMEKLRFIEVVQSNNYNMQEVPTLTVFKANQEAQRKKVKDIIEEISKKCRQNVLKGFQECLNELRKNQYNSNLEDEFSKKNNTQNFFRVKENAYESLGFPDSMNYEQRSELRKECSRFLRFSYLVDFIALESLRLVYRLSVKEIMIEFQQLIGTPSLLLYLL